MLAGCATFTDQELAGLRAQRVPPPTYEKFSRGEPLDPDEVLELRRREVADALVIRQLEDQGVTSVVSRSDVARLRKGGVSAPVIDAVLRASDEFAARHAPRDASIDMGGYDPYFDYYDPWPWYGGVGVGFTTGHYYHGHRSRRH